MTARRREEEGPEVSNLHLSDEELSAMIDEPASEKAGQALQAEALQRGVADERRLGGLHAHVAGCELCRERLALFRGVKDLLATPLPLPSDEARHQVLEGALDLLQEKPASQRESWGKRHGRAFALAASLVLLAGAGLGLGLYEAGGSPAHRVASVASPGPRERRAKAPEPKAATSLRYGFFATGSLGSFSDAASLARALASMIETTNGAATFAAAGSATASRAASPEPNASAAAPGGLPNHSVAARSPGAACVSQAPAALSSPGAMVASYRLSFKGTPAIAVVFAGSKGATTRYAAVVMAIRACKVMLKLGFS